MAWWKKGDDDLVIKPTGTVTQPEYDQTRDEVDDLLGQYDVDPNIIKTRFGLIKKGEKESGCSRSKRGEK